MWICIAPCREHTCKVLRYGTHSQEISQFYLHTPHTPANGMNHICEQSAVTETELLHLLDIAYGTLFWSCCTTTHHLGTVQTTAEGTPFSGSMNTALCDFWSSVMRRLRKTLRPTNLLTYVRKMSFLRPKLSSITYRGFLLRNFLGRTSTSKEGGVELVVSSSTWSITGDNEDARASSEWYDFVDRTELRITANMFMQTQLTINFTNNASCIIIIYL